METGFERLVGPLSSMLERGPERWPVAAFECQARSVIRARLCIPPLAAALPIREAVATYAARAGEKPRAQGSLCKAVRVSIRTGMFDPAEPKFASVPAAPDWGMRRELVSPGYTTRIDQLWRVGG